MSEDTSSTDRTTNRWAGVDAVAWGAVAVGLLAREPAVFLLAGVGVAFAAYARLGTPPRPEVEVTREIDDRTPDPDQEVDVRVTVRNEGDRTLPDVRVVDGVPPELPVVEGSPRLGTVLRAGEARSFGYTVRATRGTHSFEPVPLVCRSLNGAYETETGRHVETELTCRPGTDGAETLPLRELRSIRSGRLPTDRGGSGVEFYGVREYRPTDGAHRIDWARRARTGELTTVEFREERAATVVFLVDARPAAYVRKAGAGEPVHAVEWGVRAAATLSAGLLDERNSVGVAALGSELAWLAPGTSDDHRHRLRETLTTHPTLSPDPARDHLTSVKLHVPSGDIDRTTALQLRGLLIRLSPDAQVVFLSPLADDPAVTIARRLGAAGHAVTVLGPDVFDGETPGGRLARLQRWKRVHALYGAGVRVVEWDPDDPLALAIARERERVQEARR